MKKISNLVALVVLVGANVFTPFSYAQLDDFVESESMNVEIQSGLEQSSENETVTELEQEDSNDVSNYEMGDEEIGKVFVDDGGIFSDLSENLRDVNLKAGAMGPIPEGTIEYNRESGYIELTYDDQKIRIRDKNVGATHLGVSDYTLLLNLAHEYYDNFGYNPCGIVPTKGAFPADESYEEEFLARAQELLGRSEPLTCEDVQSIKEIYITDTYNQYEDSDYIASFGNYYYRGNNTGARREDLNVDLDNGVVNIKPEVIANGFNGGKLGEENTGWEKGKNVDNPCNGEGEYLPTLEDWKRLMQIRGGIKGYELIGDEDLRYYFGLYEARLEFAQDIWIPDAGGINQTNFLTGGFLWTAKNDNKIGILDVDNSLGILDVETYGNLLTMAAMPVRCFVYIDPVTVEFDTNEGSDIESYKVEKGTTITPPSIPTKEGYTFEGWYKDDDFVEEWDFETDEVIENVTLYAKWRTCGEGFTVMGNRCIPNNVDTNGVIKVSDGVDTIYIRDKNVGAERACSPYLDQIMELYSHKCFSYESISIGEDLEFHAIKESWTDPSEYQPECIEEDELIEQVNVILGDTTISTMDELNAYINQEFNSCVGNYYFRGNDSGANYKDFVFGDIDNGDMITNMGNLISSGFDGGRMGMPEGSGWVKGNPQNNPCNGEGEYLPTAEDWVKLMRVRGNINNIDGKSIKIPAEPSQKQTSAEITPTYSNPDVYEFMHDMQIPYAGIVHYNNCRLGEMASVINISECQEKMLYNDRVFGLWTAQQDENIGLLSYDMNYSHVNDAINQGLNDIAASVRCFVNIDNLEVLVVRLVSDGQETREVNVVSGEKLGEPSVSSRNGYIFEGWYTEEGEKYNFDNPVTEDITLYAKWTQNQSGGHSSGGGGGGSSSSKTDKTDTPANGENTETSKPTNTPGNVEDSTSDSQADDRAQDSSDRNSEQINDSKSNGNTKGSDFTPEFKEAYNYAKENGITTKSSIESANMYGNLTRIQMAKMLSNYAINVMGLKPDETRVNKFKDVSDKLDEEYNNAVTLSYQLGIMGINMPNNKFRPHDNVPRAEFVAAFSRMLFNTSDGEYKSTSKYYVHHMEKLKSEKILTNDNPTMIERRGYVMLMLMRSAR